MTGPFSRENLLRSTAAHRRDSFAARSARIALTLALADVDDPELALRRARLELVDAGRRTALEHIAEIEARARRGEPDRALVNRPARPHP